MGALSIGFAEKIIMGLGPKTALIAGLAMAGAGLLLFTRAPVDGSCAAHVLPVILLLGAGVGSQRRLPPRLRDRRRPGGRRGGHRRGGRAS